MKQDIRWKQRLQNFEKAMGYLQKALDIPGPDIIQKAGMIQFFEMSFELAWNLLKDYLEEQGFQDITSPRSAIKKAFETGLISDGRTWLQLVTDRNLTSHTYNEETANAIELLIRYTYFPILHGLLSNFKTFQ